MTTTTITPKGTLYVVARRDGTGTKRLLRAPNAAQAVRHVASEDLDCHVPDADELLELGAAGVKPEATGGGVPAPSAAAIQQPA